MKKETFCEILGDIDERYVKEARADRKVRKTVWVKWGAVAACLAAVAVLGTVLLQSGIFSQNTDVAALDNGDKIVFAKSDTVGGSLSLDADVTITPLTEEEAAVLFPALPVTADAIFQNGDGDAGASRELLGFEGQIGNVKLTISTSDVQLLDTELVGAEETSEINGTSITAGYFVTDKNSKGEQNAIYYASFALGACRVYVENAGAKENSEATKEELAEVIQKLIENGEPDLPAFLEGGN